MAHMEFTKDPPKEGKKERPKITVVDKRFWVTPDENRGKQRKSKYPTYVEELEARTKLVEEKFKEKIETLKSETEKLRDRLKRESDAELERRFDAALQPFLEVIDDLRLFLSRQTPDEIESGKNSINSKIASFLQKTNLKEDVKAGDTFDPNTAEAFRVKETDDKDMDNTVSAVLRPAFYKGEKMIRPALVEVYKYCK